MRTMKLLHTADLHIGKVVNEFSMLSDQEHILDQLLQIIEEEKVDGLIIAGDVYDRSIPPADAVTVLDNFLSKLIERNIKVFLISGNHDSPERIGFASTILQSKGLYISSNFNGEVKKVTLEDKYGNVNLYLLPFMKPATIKYYRKNENIVTYEDGVKALVDTLEIDNKERNILVTHHFITNAGRKPELSDSETMISLGGIDNIDASVFDDFDYVALGHIHRAQEIGKKHIRYAGSPIKYSFSEVFHQKSVALIELSEKGEINITLKELKPLHNMRKIKGKLFDLISEEVYKESETTDYIQATLTDENELIDPIGTLRSVYPNIMQIITMKNTLSENNMKQIEGDIKKKTTLELYKEFFMGVTDREFDAEREEVMKEMIGQITGGELS